MQALSELKGWRLKTALTCLSNQSNAIKNLVPMQLKKS